MRYIHQQKDWPNFTWDKEALEDLLVQVHKLQSKFIGAMQVLGFDLQTEATLETMTLDTLKTAEIEGEIFEPEQVRSSVARRLGLDIAGAVPSDRDVDGVVEMLFGATKKSGELLTKERLFDWHYALFPTGRSGMYKLIVGDWRDDSTGPIQVVSGAWGKERVHFQTPAANTIEREMQLFLNWLNTDHKIDPILKAGIAHFWFITIHPFEDGNGRMARAITDLLLSRADGVRQRFYSMSAQIQAERKQYYQILERSQKDDLDITNWLVWFLNCLKNALDASTIILEKVMQKHFFWTKNANTPLNERQHKLINRLLDGFKGKLTTSKWAKIAKCSTDTALRDIQDLMAKGILEKAAGGGRSTNYILITV